MDGQTQNVKNPNVSGGSQPQTVTSTNVSGGSQPQTVTSANVSGGSQPQTVTSASNLKPNIALDSIKLASFILLILGLFGVLGYAIYKVILMLQNPDNNGKSNVPILDTYYCCPQEGTNEKDYNTVLSICGSKNNETDCKKESRSCSWQNRTCSSGGDDGGGDVGGGDWLDRHNYYRKKAWGASENLVWDANLAAGAEDWAKELVSKNEFDHSKNLGNQKIKTTKGCDGMSSGCGENLYKVMGKALDPNEVVKAWYDECSDYNGKFTEGTGHYTQLVWKGAKKVGCGVAGSNSGGIGVCWYDKGNILDCPSSCKEDPSCCSFESGMIPTKGC